MSHQAPQYDENDYQSRYRSHQVYYGAAADGSDDSSSLRPYFVLLEHFDSGRLQVIFPLKFGLPTQEVWFERRVVEPDSTVGNDQKFMKDTVLVSQQLQNLLKSRTDATVKGDNATGEFTRKKRNYKPVVRVELLGGASFFVKVDSEDLGALSLSLEGTPRELPETVFVYRAATLPKKSKDDTVHDYPVFINIDKSINRYHEYRESQSQSQSQ